MKLTLIFAVSLALGFNALAQSSVDEYQVKAAFLYNFVKFIEWPSASAPLNRIDIGIVGSGPAADAVETFCKGKSINGKPLTTRRLNWDEDLHSLHIVFVSDLDQKKIRRILTAAMETGALTVGDVEGFTAQGGMINFFVQDAKVRFEINSDSASLAGFRISSQLLSLAKPVFGEHSSGRKRSQ